MSDYRERIVVEAPPAEVFRFVSLAGNIPQYVPFIQRVTLEGDRIAVLAEPAKQQRELSGFFRVNEERRRIDWGTDGAPPYRGFLEVRDAGGGRRAELTVELSIERRDDTSVRQALRQCVEAIKRLVEERGKVAGGGAA